MDSTTVTVTNPLGLHLRTGREVVQVANQFQAAITAQNLSNDSPQVDAKSILQLMQLQARQGHILLLCAEGPDAQLALNALVAIFSLGGMPTII
ncbi:MAG: HPr family phosphocarrier protein [Caldilineaceae bacterium]